MDAVKLGAAGAFIAGLVITLVLSAYLTPRAWWRRPNARALFILIAGAWGFGSLILYAAHAPAFAIPERAAAQAAPAPSAPVPDPIPDAESAAFRVHRDLNLRAAPGVHSARVAVVPAGASVTPTGLRHGDWWQVEASIDGVGTTGWVSSLWLRRSSE
jgi:hypothetical protein